MNVYEITLFQGVYHGEKGDIFITNNQRLVVIHALNKERAEKKITLKPGEDKSPHYRTTSEAIYCIKRTGTVTIKPYYEYSDGRSPRPVK